MTKTLFGCILLLCALNLWTAPAGRALSSVYIPALAAAAQDSTGTVWALPVSNGGGDTSGTVYRWQGATWTAQVVPGAAGFRPLVLTRGDDGSVYVLWQKWDQYQAALPPLCLVTVQRGVGSRVLAHFSGEVVRNSGFPSTPTIYAGAGGDVWVKGDQPILQHIVRDGSVQIFPLKAEQYQIGKLPGANMFPTPPLRSLADGQGRRWFWQDEMHPGFPPGGLHGVLVWNGTTLDYHATLPGLPDGPFSVVVPQDPEHFWVAETRDNYPPVNTSRSGLYQIDTKTLTAISVTPPVPGAFQSITRIFQIHGDWCVLEHSFVGGPHTILWRRHGAVWHKEPASLAESQSGYGNYGNGMPNAVLETPQGTWLAATSAGLEWLPADGKPTIHVDWRRGLTAGKVSDLFRLPKGNILAFADFGQGYTVLPPLPNPLYPARPGVSIGCPGPPMDMGDMLADSHRHLWGLKYVGGPPILDEWDGKQWHEHPLPKIKSGTLNAGLYACDTQGRIWLTASIWNPPAQPQPIDGRFVYDPARDMWAQYPTVPDALAATASQPGLAFLSSQGSYNLPLFSRDGRVAYVNQQTLFLYDGKIWHHWNNRDIQPGYSYGNEPANPRFNPAGHLEITLDTHAYEWTPETGWMPNGLATPVSAAPPLPPGGPQGFWGPTIQDNQGGAWGVWNGAVYLTRYGLWRKQTALSGPGSPFFGSRSLQNVLQDPTGRYFFETAYGGASEYVVWTPPASALPAAPRIQITPLAADSVRLHFAAKRPKTDQLQWRLNGGAWSPPLTTDTVTLTALRPGAYHVEAQTLDTLLQASPTPSAAVFVVQPASAMQIARWVQALLHGTDDARESAVKGLVKQPDLALPALEAARPGASDDARWWLDAAIQQIADQNRQSETTGQ
jgi:hypothetical protein